MQPLHFNAYCVVCVFLHTTCMVVVVVLVVLVLVVGLMVLELVVVVNLSTCLYIYLSPFTMAVL